MQQKKIKSLENSVIKQMKNWKNRNDDNILGIPKTNLELKNMFILCS